jgi:hypothetical protein
MLLNKELLVGVYDSTLTYLPFWTFAKPASGNTLSNFSVGYSSVNIAKIVWGDGGVSNLPSEIVTSYSYGQINTGLTLSPVDTNRNKIFYKIVCGISSPALSGSIDIKPYTNLTFFSNVNNNVTSFTGSQSLTSLLEVYLNYNSLSGNIPALSGNSALQRFECHNNRYTGFAGGGVSNTLDTFRADSNLLTTGAINTLLSAFVVANRTTGSRILNLGGTNNAAPSGQGITDKNSLLGLGWTVTTN